MARANKQKDNMPKNVLFCSQKLPSDTFLEMEDRDAKESAVYKPERYGYLRNSPVVFRRRALELAMPAHALVVIQPAALIIDVHVSFVITTAEMSLSGRAGWPGERIVWISSGFRPALRRGEVGSPIDS